MGFGIAFPVKPLLSDPKFTYWISGFIVNGFCLKLGFLSTLDCLFDGGGIAACRCIEVPRGLAFQ